MTRTRPRSNPPVEPVKERPVAEVPQHSHDAPQGMMRALTVAILLIVLIIGYAGWLQFGTSRRQADTNERLVQLEEYVAKAKALRDTQNAVVNDRIDIAACGFLDRLPAGPLWDPMREQYNCGPGIPLDEYPSAYSSVTPEQFYSVFPQSRDYNN